MRKRRNGFTDFMQKKNPLTKGEPQNDNFFETEGFGSELYQRYECLLGLLRGEYCWGTYLDRINDISYSQRHACWTLRNHLRLDIPFSKVGVYVTHRGLYREAIEYIREYQASGEQVEVQRTSFTSQPEPVSADDFFDL